MEKAYFPLFVDLSEKNIVVVGGGTVAARRVETLLTFAGHITVIAPKLQAALVKLETEGKITCLHREYREGDINGAHLVLAATDDREVNRSVKEECRALGQKCGGHILFNAADDRSRCDFYFPAVVQKDEIVIGINSGGKNPGKVKEIRKQLEETDGA